VGNTAKQLCKFVYFYIQKGHHFKLHPNFQFTIRMTGDNSLQHSVTVQKADYQNCSERGNLTGFSYTVVASDLSKQ